MVESALSEAGERFVANDLSLGPADRLWLITGPNMGGKSTFLRQTALVAVLAQAGSFVPAARAKVGIVDRLFSRVGAADNLARGRSTFMVEMVETAAILAQATPHSLVILDEIGRGTSTYDGLAIAWAVVEAMHDQVQCRTLFATHYHELTRLAGRLDCLSLHHVRAREWKGDLVLFHEVADGAADRSYGIAVAKLAGLPPAVVARARSVLAKLEAGRDATGGIAAGLDDLPLFAAAAEPEPAPDPIAAALAEVEPDKMSPREALDELYRLKAIAARAMSLFDIDNQRAIIDRRALTERIAAVRAGRKQGSEVSAILREALEAGRAEIGRRLAEEPGRGRAAAQATAFLHDQIVRLAYDYVTERVVGAPIGGEVALVGLGGTGRGEMAPYSDFDLMVLTPKAPSAEVKAAAEAILHLLWELKLKVGHSVRSTSELIALAKKDMTIRTALLEGRWLWGDDKLFDAAMRRFRKEVVAGTAAEFVAAKLAERDQRHLRMGDSRYVVEPNVKDGKGGLRDLHTLYWIGKYVHGVERPADLVGAGLLTPAEFRAVRARRAILLVGPLSLAPAAGRAEERLGFEYQPRIAEIMHYADRPGKSSVERFMQFYFLNAKTVGDLTGVFLAQLDEQLGKKGFRFALPTIRRRAEAPRRVHARSRPPVDPVGRFLPRRSGAAARAVRPRRARADRNPSQPRCAPQLAMRCGSTARCATTRARTRCSWRS